jgi:hypothetical protein
VLVARSPASAALQVCEIWNSQSCCCMPARPSVIYPVSYLYMRPASLLQKCSEACAACRRSCSLTYHAMFLPARSLKAWILRRLVRLAGPAWIAGLAHGWWRCRVAIICRLCIEGLSGFVHQCNEHCPAPQDVGHGPPVAHACMLLLSCTRKCGNLDQHGVASLCIWHCCTCGNSKLYCAGVSFVAIISFCSWAWMLKWCHCAAASNIHHLCSTSPACRTVSAEQLLDQNQKHSFSYSL